MFSYQFLSSLIETSFQDVVADFVKQFTRFFLTLNFIFKWSSPLFFLKNNRYLQFNFIVQRLSVRVYWHTFSLNRCIYCIDVNNLNSCWFFANYFQDWSWHIEFSTSWNKILSYLWCIGINTSDECFICKSLLFLIKIGFLKLCLKFQHLEV